jgi:hypothetical protein
LNALPNWPSRKLYGDRLGNFAAFGSEDFITSDWVWGRVDGALTLARALLVNYSGDDRDEMMDALVQEILAEEHTSPHGLYDSTTQALAATPQTILERARDGGGTNFVALLSDARSYLASASWLAAPPQGKRRWWQNAILLVLTVAHSLARRWARG